MDLFDVLNMIGGLCLFLFGMNVMGQALERRAGNKLRSVLRRLTTSKSAGLLTGLGVTAVIQSSSATTVMVVGFVNSSLMTLKQAINVIMGANIGTTVTAWILSLSGIDSSNVFVSLLKPTSFTPILALIGIVFYMFCKSDKKKDTGAILLGFATLMFGMDTMSSAVSGLKDVPEFQQLFLMFENPFLGMLAGALLTAVIQSSSASVGILQALALTGQVTLGAAIPIIMGQNIGTRVTAILSSVGANKNAKRAALVHLLFNVIGTAVWLALFSVVQAIFALPILDESATQLSIAVCHSIFNVLCTLLLLPMSGVLERAVCKLIPDAKKPEVATELDERLLATPPVALERSRMLATDMAATSCDVLKTALNSIFGYTPENAEHIREMESRTDQCEDMLGSYLVKLSSLQISEESSSEAAGLLKLIGDYERIADHGLNLLDASEEIFEKQLSFSDHAREELAVISAAASEALDLATAAFTNGDLDAAAKVEPLEQVIDDLTERMRNRHIKRLQKGQCSIESGFVWADMLNSIERTSDHCSNIAVCIIDMSNNSMHMHESLRAVRADSESFRKLYKEYSEKYAL